MIDPILSLSFNVASEKGVYAVLLGSGASRSAGVLTGWEVTLDLVAKLAQMEGEDCRGNELEWYEAKFGTEPDYSELLKEVAPKSAAQQHLLRAYFEPTIEEQEEGKKLPTPAHRAIARLVRKGFIRVIISTNFDRLMESALEAEGVSPIVVSSADAAKGAPPLVHSKCTLIKIHGDYLDHRIKNSPEDLAEYDEVLNDLLDQVFDEYGLIICGWSSDYDLALRNAILRSKVRRYPMYFCARSELSASAKSIVSSQKAIVVGIDDADSFFRSLDEKIESLEQFNKPHPLSVDVAVASLKRYLSEDRFRIQLRDLLFDEAVQVVSTFDRFYSDAVQHQPAAEPLKTLMSRLEGSCSKLVSLFAVGAFYAKDDQSKPFYEAFNVVIASPKPSAGYKIWSDIRGYPALLLVYAAGIASVASERFHVLNQLASRTYTVDENTQEVGRGAQLLDLHSVLSRDAGRQLLEGYDRRKTPVSDYLFDKLREKIRPMLSNDQSYELAFDNFEYLWCLLHVDTCLQDTQRVWTPFGAFIWRRERAMNWIETEIDTVIAKRDEIWPPLAHGLFGGSVARLEAARDAAKDGLCEIGRHIRFS